MRNILSSEYLNYEYVIFTLKRFPLIGWHFIGSSYRTVVLTNAPMKKKKTRDIDIPLSTGKLALVENNRTSAIHEL